MIIFGTENEIIWKKLRLLALLVVVAGLLQ
jgi:hypothetical protein